MTEFWADGPKSETPPGHWNVSANLVSDELAPDLRIGGTRPPVDRLQWDVKLYLALNGAVHDAAIAAWGLKGYYDSVRPISMIRYMGGLGQSSDPSAPVVRRRGPAAGPGPHRADHAGDHRRGPASCGARRSRGRDRHPRLGGQPAGPEDRDRAASAWILAVDWVPVPAADVRDAVVPGLRVRAQHVQPGGRRGHERHSPAANTSRAASAGTRSRRAR